MCTACLQMAKTSAYHSLSDFSTGASRLVRTRWHEHFRLHNSQLFFSNFLWIGQGLSNSLLFCNLVLPLQGVNVRSVHLHGCLVPQWMSGNVLHGCHHNITAVPCTVVHLVHPLGAAKSTSPLQGLVTVLPACFECSCFKTLIIQRNSKPKEMACKQPVF